MAWYTLPNDMKERPCSICSETVHHGDPFYFTDSVEAIAHARCIWEKAEDKDPHPKGN